MKNLFRILLVIIIAFFAVSKTYADVPYEVFKTKTTSEITIRSEQDVIVRDGKAINPDIGYTDTGKPDTRVKTHISGIHYSLEYRNVGSMGNKGWLSLGGYDKATLTISYIVDITYYLHDTGVAHPMFENNNFFEEKEVETQYIDSLTYDLNFTGGPYGSFRLEGKKGVFQTVGYVVDGAYVWFSNFPKAPYAAFTHDVKIPTWYTMFGKWMEKLVIPPCKDSGIRFSDYNGEVMYRPDDDEDAWTSAELDVVLCVNTHIRTGDDSTCSLSLQDMTTFKMKPESEIILSTPPDRENKLKLITGKVLVNIKRMLKDGTMDVEMSQAIAGARGTIFELEETGTESKIKVFEGTVEFTSKATGEKSMVGVWETQTADSEGLSEKTTKDNQEVFKKINNDRKEWMKMKETPLKPLLSQEEINKIRVKNPDRGEIKLEANSIAPGLTKEEQKSIDNLEQESNKKENSEKNGNSIYIIVILLFLGFIGFLYIKNINKK